MFAEVGIGWGHLISNAESLSSNQQFCVKSEELRTSSSIVLLASLCELDDKIISFPPEDIQVVRGLGEGAAVGP